MQTRTCLNQTELAARWSISARTLERWRWTGEGPAFLQSNTLTHDGSFPVNTCGGQLSAGQAGAAGVFDLPPLPPGPHGAAGGRGGAGALPRQGRGGERVSGGGRS